MSYVRFCYQVTGTAKFLSHLDLLKYFGRSLRRAGLPVAYSEGFNPHPRIAFGPPRPVAVEGRAEYCDVILKTDITAEAFVQSFNAALPANIQVTEAKVFDAKIKPLQAAINLAVYTAYWQPDAVDFEKLEQGAADFLAADVVPFLRRNPQKGDKEIDLRPAVVGLKAGRTNAALTLTMELEFLPQGSVKPSELLEYLCDAVPLEVCRDGLFILEDGKQRAPWS